jgi:ATP-dependent protease HslVU (ClpYQ) peptidase subunit
MYFVANLMNVLEKLEEQIDQVSVDYEKSQFELWKDEQEKELMNEIANRRYAYFDNKKVCIF